MSGKDRDLQNDRVFQGLQRKKRCALCLQDFFVDELPGAISYKSVLELRKTWGVDQRVFFLCPPPLGGDRCVMGREGW